MTEQKNPIILSETEAPARRLVQISAEYEVDFAGSNVMLLTASMTESSVRFRRMASDEEQRNFSLTAEEADTFCEAWITYHNKLEAIKEAENNRQLEIIGEAFALAGKHITIETRVSDDGTVYWNVSCPASGWGVCTVYHADALLRDVKNAHEHYTRHQKYQRTSKSVAGGDAA